MLFWYILLLLAGCVILIDLSMERRRRRSKSCHFASILILSILSIPLLLAGQMGMDYEGYKYFYDNLPAFGEYWRGADILPHNVEFGYQLIVMFAKSLNLGIRGPYFLSYLLACFAFLYGCRLASIPFLTGTALFILLIYPDFYGQQRMAVVTAFGVLSLGFLASRKQVGILLVTTIGTMFQYVSFAYLVAAAMLYVDKLSGSRGSFSGLRTKVSFCTLHKTIATDRLTLLIPIGLGAAFFSFASSMNQLGILQLAGFLESNFSTSAIVEKFLSYFYRSQFIEPSLLGSFATSVLIISCVLSFSKSPVYPFIRYGLVYLAVSVVVFLVFSPMPIMSYRVVNIFFNSGLLVVSAIILSRKEGSYIPALLALVLILNSYLELIWELGPYSM